MHTEPGLIEIFRAGTHTAEDGRTLTFSAADVDALAASYDATLSEAPLVVGHPQSNAAPAYGWAKSLRAKDGVLYAQPHQVDAAFAEMVNAGRFKKRSASIYLGDTPGNPLPGKLYLRHVGFLGAAAPAVKGLRDAQFADGGAAVEFAMPASYLGQTVAEVLGRVRDWFVETQGADKADQIIPAWQLRSLDEMARAEVADNTIAAPAYAAPAAAGITTETTMPTDNQAADFAERESQLNTLQTDLAKREKAIKDREDTARRDDAVSFASQLVTDGRLLPRHQAPVVELLLALPSAPVSFAQGDATVSKPGAEVLRELLGSLPKQVDFSEKAGADTDATAVGAASFAAPPGQSVDARALEIHRKAVAYQADHQGVDYLAAVRAVGG